jgi:dihydroorotate dehydrogenase
MGFGHIEVGTVTPKPQPGNPKPRIFRLPKDQALINRMGFPSEGAEKVAVRLKKRPEGVVIGVNIGKNKDTPLGQAEQDYLACFDTLFDVADYFTVNVSSPNTPGLRELQDREPLLKILGTIQSANRSKLHPKPVLLKVSPDLTHEQVVAVIDVAKSTGIDGFVATNTTVSRENLATSPGKIAAIGDGGLSGTPLRNKSDRVIRLLAESGLPIVACGGLSTTSDVRQVLHAGAKLVQTYTALIFRGPSVVRTLSEGMRTGQTS